jgi:hypothetical protein
MLLSTVSERSRSQSFGGEQYLVSDQGRTGREHGPQFWRNHGSRVVVLMIGRWERYQVSSYPPATTEAQQEFHEKWMKSLVGGAAGWRGGTTTVFRVEGIPN